MLFVMGWIANNIHKALYPPVPVIKVIKIFILEAEYHFRKLLWNPLQMNQRLWEEMEQFTDEETEEAVRKQLQSTDNDDDHNSPKMEKRMKVNNQKEVNHEI